MAKKASGNLSDAPFCCQKSRGVIQQAAEAAGEAPLHEAVLPGAEVLGARRGVASSRQRLVTRKGIGSVLGAAGHRGPVQLAAEGGSVICMDQLIHALVDETRLEQQFPLRKQPSVDLWVHSSVPSWGPGLIQHAVTNVLSCGLQG